MVKINDITYGIERWDIMSRAKTYRYEQESTISTEDVKCILLDYNIGKKPLAKLLGGEKLQSFVILKEIFLLVNIHRSCYK